jgi:hypothetical protein
MWAAIFWAVAVIGAVFSTISGFWAPSATTRPRQ